ncbi:hypothetical protein EG68_04988 [Paragonimus skrjabini miyazakii]|uniref:Uncharacterized protein n=1 Tax=Paragonimus skrjabini miyazakii TaxID=59628 RepID=A0A8S9YZP1_9TREM|nr:hypothetical protein EG68_04988 [Paragonimus skrjabini miyazakii]
MNFPAHKADSFGCEGEIDEQPETFDRIYHFESPIHSNTLCDCVVCQSGCISSEVIAKPTGRSGDPSVAMEQNATVEMFVDFTDQFFTDDQMRPGAKVRERRRMLNINSAFETK